MKVIEEILNGKRNFCTKVDWYGLADTAWKVSKYGVISGRYFPVFSPNAGKYGPEITPYLNTFHAVRIISTSVVATLIWNFPFYVVSTLYIS